MYKSLIKFIPHPQGNLYEGYAKNPLYLSNNPSFSVQWWIISEHGSCWRRKAVPIIDEEHAWVSIGWAFSFFVTLQEDFLPGPVTQGSPPILVMLLTLAGFWLRPWLCSGLPRLALFAVVPFEAFGSQELSVVSSSDLHHSVSSRGLFATSFPSMNLRPAILLSWGRIFHYLGSIIISFQFTRLVY